MRLRSRRREEPEQPSTRPRGNPRCVCADSAGATGLVLVVAREGEFRTGLGNPIPEGREVAVACKCEVGDWVNERRSDEYKLPVFHGGMLSVKSVEAPLPTVGPMEPDSWD